MKYLTFEKKYFKKKIKNQIYFKDWCLPDGIKYEEINKLSEKKYFNYKFSNQSQIIKNNKFIFKFINKIFPGLTNKMNNYHGVNYNDGSSDRNAYKMRDIKNCIKRFPNS